MMQAQRLPGARCRPPAVPSCRGPPARRLRRSGGGAAAAARDAASSGRCVGGGAAAPPPPRRAPRPPRVANDVAPLVTTPTDIDISVRGPRGGAAPGRAPAAGCARARPSCAAARARRAPCAPAFPPSPRQLAPLGASDLLVSNVTLGTMTFGEQTGEAEAHRMLSLATDVGVNFIDTAEVRHPGSLRRLASPRCLASGCL
jgi:hypothetical protein